MIEITELLKDCQRHHSTLQLDSFITVRAGMTLYGCYRQSLREISTRVGTIREMRHQMRVSEIRIRKWRDSGDELKAAKADNMEGQRPAMLAELNEMQTELDRFHAQAIALRAMLEADGVTFPLDSKKKDELDRDMWVHLLKSQAAIELMTGALGKSTIEIFRALPRSMKQELAIVFNPERRQELCDWFLNYETPVPEMMRIECSKSYDSPRLSQITSLMGAPVCHESSSPIDCCSAKAASIDAA